MPKFKSSLFSFLFFFFFFYFHWTFTSPALHLFLFGCFFKFILRKRESEWERASTCTSREGAERERKNPKQAPHCQCSDVGTNCEIMTWAKSKCWTLNRLSHSGDPYIRFSVFHIIFYFILISNFLSRPLIQSKH